MTEFYTTTQVAQLLGYHPTRLRALAAGSIIPPGTAKPPAPPSRNVGGRRLWSIADVARWAKWTYQVIEERMERMQTRARHVAAVEGAARDGNGAALVAGLAAIPATSDSDDE